MTRKKSHRGSSQQNLFLSINIGNFKEICLLNVHHKNFSAVFYDKEKYGEMAEIIFENLFNFPKKFKSKEFCIFHRLLWMQWLGKLFPNWI